VVVAFYFRLHLAYFSRPAVAISARPEHPYYHILDTVTKYDNPAIYGKTGRRPYANQISPFCVSEKAEAALFDIVKRARFGNIYICHNFTT